MYIYLELLLEHIWKAGEAAQRVKVLDTKPDVLSLIPQNFCSGAGSANCLLTSIPTPGCVHACVYTSIYTHKKLNAKKPYLRTDPSVLYYF